MSEHNEILTKVNNTEYDNEHVLRVETEECVSHIPTKPSIKDDAEKNYSRI